MKFILAVALLAISQSAWTQVASLEPICEAKDARENFACSIAGAFMLCESKAKLVLLGGSNWDDVQTCRARYQPAVRKAYDAALAKLKGKPAAQKEAKAAYAQWIAATDGLLPKTDENKMGYRARTGSLDDALNKSLASFKIEAGIE